MKRFLVILFTTFLMFSSCKFAEALNAKVGLQAPADANIITVFSDFETSNYCVVDLGKDFKWNSTKLTLNKLLENEKFSAWYYSLTNEQWNTVGIYDPYTEKGLLSGDTEFTVSKREAFCVGWNSPFERIRILANNETNKFFDYKFDKTIYAYDEEVEISYGSLCEDFNFSEWQNGLDYFKVQAEEGYYFDLYPTKFVKEEITGTNYNSVQLYSSVKVTKWNFFVRLGWSSNRTFNTLRFHSNNGEDDVYTLVLDDFYTEYTLSWDELMMDESFKSWYDSITKEGYVKRGIGLQNGGSFFGPYDSSLWSFDAYLTDFYVIWEKTVDSVKIYANNGTKVSYTISLPGDSSNYNLSWLDLEKDDGFMTWYKALENGSEYKLGLGNKNGEIFIHQYNTNNSHYIYSSSSGNELYVIWNKKFAEPSWCNLQTNGLNYISAGESVQLLYYAEGYSSDDGFYAYDVGIESVAFTSNNPEVAEVDAHGLVTGKSSGTAEISITMYSYTGQTVTTTTNVYVSENSEFERFEIPYMNAIVMSDNGQILAGSDSYGVYVSTDYGKNWNKSFSFDTYSSYNNIVMSPFGSCIVLQRESYVSINDGWVREIYLSTDSGKSFSSLVTLDSYVNNLCVSDDGLKIFYSREYGLSESMERVTDNWYTLDGGNTWSTFLPGQCIDALRISSSGEHIVCGTTKGMYYSQNYGSSFELISEEIGINNVHMSSDGTRIAYIKESTPYIYDVYNKTSEVINTPVNSVYSDNFFISPDLTKYLVRQYETDSYGSYYYNGFSWNKLNQKIPDYSRILLSDNSVVCMINDFSYRFGKDFCYLFIWKTN